MNNEINKLKQKAKQGWKCYFIEREKIYDLQDSLLESTQLTIVLNNSEAPPVEYEFLKKQYLELYQLVGKLIECPVCYCEMTKDNIELPLCGHSVCKSCKKQLQDCPICRRKY